MQLEGSSGRCKLISQIFVSNTEGELCQVFMGYDRSKGRDRSNNSNLVIQFALKHRSDIYIYTIKNKQSHQEEASYLTPSL